MRLHHPGDATVPAPPALVTHYRQRPPTLATAALAAVGDALDGFHEPAEGEYGNDKRNE
jgi:hypothetical protein